ncbi:hypothetical protein CSKR_110369 [Clonorchis sinensis]|uniref:Uncharacterized protein n=1 Tax=Clonorchis sinensis TaxID=79923 RepID=A0A8T1MSS0_CLOSI|nr:hypothetical protein CSKR_110369 [Clonorchis sinensis]
MAGTKSQITTLKLVWEFDSRLSGIDVQDWDQSSSAQYRAAELSSLMSKVTTKKALSKTIRLSLQNKCLYVLRASIQFQQALLTNMEKKDSAIVGVNKINVYILVDQLCEVVMETLQKMPFALSGQTYTDLVPVAPNPSDASVPCAECRRQRLNNIVMNASNDILNTKPNYCTNTTAVVILGVADNCPQTFSEEWTTFRDFGPLSCFLEYKWSRSSLIRVRPAVQMSLHSQVKPEAIMHV